MDEQNEPERIEIELTSHESTGGPRRSALAGDRDGDESNDTAVDTAVGESSGGVLGTERGRLIAVTAFAGVVALLVGVLVGRSGSDGAPADGAATVTTALERTTTTVSGDSEVLPPVRTVVTAPVDEPDPTDGTVDPAAPVKNMIDVAPEFDDLGVEIVGLTRSNEIIRIDPAAGTTVAYPPVSELAPSGIHAGTGWILVSTTTFDGPSNLVVLADDGTTSIIETEDRWPVGFSDDGSGRFWLLEDGDDGPRVVEMLVSGEPTGSYIDFTDYPRLIDPLGGFVIDAPGGSYRVWADGTERLTRGHVVAVGRSIMLIAECDDVLACEHLVVDRETGARRRVDVVPDVRQAILDAGLGLWLAEDMFNDAEDRLLLGFWDPVDQRERVGVLDLEFGDFTELAGVSTNQLNSMRWTPDDRSILGLDDAGRLVVFDIATGESRRFSNALVRLKDFAVRSVS